MTNMAPPFSGSQLLGQALPDLSITDNRTPRHYKMCIGQSTSTLIGIPTANASLMDTEYFSVADEHGVRFRKNVGQIVSTVASKENQGFSFSDSKAATLKSAGIPDFTVISQTSSLLVVGKLKSPWIQTLETIG
ncbi:hypothetical protein N7493_004144 [Penicillium malachiteum]|uniref:Uncharacterized protein n=1 Tax=Penicillium malachiteum TaxID=1324776 RepID=A0AAD6MY85_9EURO|nr:hypothetical protein N7493_004144 [Penicillium malachiteum]